MFHYTTIYIAYRALCVQFTIRIYRATFYLRFSRTQYSFQDSSNAKYLPKGRNSIFLFDFQSTRMNLIHPHMASSRSSAHARGSRGRSKHHPGCLPTPPPRSSKINPRGRRDAGHLLLLPALPFRFLAVTTLAATLCRRRAHVQGSFHLLLFSWPWRTSRRGL